MEEVFSMELKTDPGCATLRAKMARTTGLTLPISLVVMGGVDVSEYVKLTLLPAR